MVARTARLSAAPSFAQSLAKAAAAPRTVRRFAAPASRPEKEPEEELRDGDAAFDQAAGAARILVGSDPSPAEPTGSPWALAGQGDAGLSGANWLSGPTRRAARARREARRAAVRPGRAGAVRRAA